MRGVFACCVLVATGECFVFCVRGCVHVVCMCWCVWTVAESVDELIVTHMQARACGVQQVRFWEELLLRNQVGLHGVE